MKTTRAKSFCRGPGEQNNTKQLFSAGEHVGGNRRAPASQIWPTIAQCWPDLANSGLNLTQCHQSWTKCGQLWNNVRPTLATGANKTKTKLRPAAFVEHCWSSGLMSKDRRDEE